MSRNTIANLEIEVSDVNGPSVDSLRVTTDFIFSFYIFLSLFYFVFLTYFLLFSFFFVSLLFHVSQRNPSLIFCTVVFRREGFETKEPVRLDVETAQSLLATHMRW